MKKLISLIFSLLFIVGQCSLPGGVNDGEITDDILEIADWAANQMPTITGDSDHIYTVQEVVNVQTQVVSGIKYILTIIFTNNNQSDTLKCVLSVWDQPWLNKREIVGTPSCE